MKNSIKRMSALMFIAVAFVVMPLQAANNVHISKTEIADILKDNLVGGWEYTVDGAPEGYESGLLMIIKAGDIYKVQVQLVGGAMNGTDIVVKGNDISFKLMVEGESVSVSLSAKGSQISGTSTSSSGTYNIKGVKSISPQ